jgi:hypothetical protein
MEESKMNDKVVNEIIKIEKNSKITMTVHDDTQVYKFNDNPEDDDYELHVIGCKKNTIYGLSCCSVIEVIGILIQDYANEIITDVTVVNE